MHKQTKIFARRVEDFMHVPSVNVTIGTMCDDVIQVDVVKNKSQCCIVTDSHGKLAGNLCAWKIFYRVWFLK